MTGVTSMVLEEPTEAGVRRFRSVINWAAPLVVIMLCTWGMGPIERAQAQVNAETLTEAITKSGWGLGAKSSLGYSSGNVSLLSVRGETAVRYATLHPDMPPDSEVFWFRDRLLVHGSAGLTKANGDEVANDGVGHVRFTHMHWLRVGGEVFGQAQYDDFRLLQRRLVAGTGLRVVVWNVPVFRTWFGTGYMLEVERRNIAPENRPPLGPDPEDMTNHRWNSYISLSAKVVEDLVELLSTTYVQPRFDDFKDLQLLQEARLQVKVTAYLSLSTELAMRLDSRAPVGVAKRDLRIGQGMVLTL